MRALPRAWQGRDRSRVLNGLDRLYRIRYIFAMDYIVTQMSEFSTWLLALRDLRAQVAIGRRIDRAAAGNLGDVKPVGGRVSEMRVDIGAGYRLYFTMRARRVVLLLAGGDKSTQDADIQRAIKLAQEG